MDVPILVAIISVGGTLSGAVVGGSIAFVSNAYLTRRRENLEFRMACRLVAADFHEAHHTVKFALENKRWWRPDEELTTEAWKQYRNVLAAHLSYDALADVGFAVRATNKANVIATAPRPSDRTEEIFLDETRHALTLLMQDIEKGRVVLMPYFL